MTAPLALVASHKVAPRLRIWDHRGFRPVESADGVGEVRTPVASAEGWIAFQFVSHGVPEPWLSGTAILDSEGSLVDILPAALPTAAPAWSPDATELARVVSDHAGRSRLEVVTIHTGDSRVLLESPGITAVSWPTPTELFVADGSRVISMNSSTGSAIVRLEWATAEKFLSFGSDDIYPTIAHIATGEDRRAVQVRWHNPGRPSVSWIYWWTDDGISLEPQAIGYRQPVFLRDRRLLLSTDNRVISIDEQGSVVWQRNLPGLIAAAPWLCGTARIRP